MTIAVFIPCFIDLMYPQVGISMVRLFERLSHRVVMPEGAAYCGQPAFNTGYWDEARGLAVKVLEQLKEADAVVIPSGSCGAMVKVFYPQLFAGRPEAAAAAFALIKEKYRTGYSSMMSFITGPSRTGDIERILVLGAHGPKRLTVLLSEFCGDQATYNSRRF